MIQQIAIGYRINFMQYVNKLAKHKRLLIIVSPKTHRQFAWEYLEIEVY